MKKTIVLALMFALLFAFSACGGAADSTDPIVGTWVLHSMVEDGETTLYEDATPELQAKYDTVKLVIEGDGNYSYAVNDTVITGTWKNSDGAYVFSQEGYEDNVVQLTDGLLHLYNDPEDASNCLVLKKQ